MWSSITIPNNQAIRVNTRKCIRKNKEEKEQLSAVSRDAFHIDTFFHVTIIYLFLTQSYLICKHKACLPNIVPLFIFFYLCLLLFYLIFGFIILLLPTFFLFLCFSIHIYSLFSFCIWPLHDNAYFASNCRNTKITKKRSYYQIKQ